MFDTSIVKAHAIAAPRHTTLLISVGIHSVAVIAAIGLTAAATTIPVQPPKQFELYRPVEVPRVPPPPLGVPNGGRRAQTPAAPRPQPAAPQQVTAPEVIPDQTPVVANVPIAPGPGPASTDPNAIEGPIGSPIGVPNSVGPIDSTTTETAPPVWTPGVAGVVSARVLRRVEPRFPPGLAHGVPSAIVIVHCVIDRNGDIRDPQIVMSSFPAFNESVLTALRQWKFAPGTMRGQPVDTYFELTVKFQVVR